MSRIIVEHNNNVVNVSEEYGMPGPQGIQGIQGPEGPSGEGGSGSIGPLTEFLEADEYGFIYSNYSDTTLGRVTDSTLVQEGFGWHREEEIVHDFMEAMNFEQMDYLSEGSVEVAPEVFIPNISNVNVIRDLVNGIDVSLILNFISALIKEPSIQLSVKNPTDGSGRLLRMTSSGYRFEIALNNEVYHGDPIVAESYDSNPVRYIKVMSQTDFENNYGGFPPNNILFIRTEAS